jgi:hypothetical protein
MGAFLATAEGRGRPITKTGNPKTGARAMAGTWNVRGEVRAFRSSPGGVDANHLSLTLQPLGPTLLRSLRPGSAEVGPRGDALTLWTGTEAEALLMAERGQSHAKAAALAALALRIACASWNAMPPGTGPAAAHLDTAGAELVKTLQYLGVR